jgi:hypothetical protein
LKLSALSPYGHRLVHRGSLAEDAGLWLDGDDARANVEQELRPIPDIRTNVEHEVAG